MPIFPSIVNDHAMLFSAVPCSDSIFLVSACYGPAVGLLWACSRDIIYVIPAMLYHTCHAMPCHTICIPAMMLALKT